VPELPEAETIVRGLRPGLTGGRLERVFVRHADVLETTPERFADRVAGQSVEELGRRGKNIVIGLGGGDRIVVNLGMSGRLLLRSPDDTSPPPTHPAVIFELEPGAGTLVYHDVRRFGLLRCLDAATFRAWSAGLGPEPLGPTFTAASLGTALARSRSPVRSWLLDQRRIAGVGNIYANEALHRARIHPATPASAIPEDRIGPLHRALRQVLRDAIQARGTTLRDYRTAQGWEGSYGGRLRVYGREGEPCSVCGTAIERSVLSNRSAFHCPECQRLPGAGPSQPDPSSRNP
jgi:formamidopyrimidine-DNA glycosylase